MSINELAQLELSRIYAYQPITALIAHSKSKAMYKVDPLLVMHTGIYPCCWFHNQENEEAHASYFSYNAEAWEWYNTHGDYDR